MIRPEKNMRLKWQLIKIKDIRPGYETNIANACLYVDLSSLRSALLEDKYLAEVNLELVRPGESARIVNVLDVIEPRFKVKNGTGSCLPSRDEVPLIGEGVTCVLQGAAVTLCGTFPGAAEGVIEMVGPGAALTPFSRLHHLVIIGKPASGVNRVQFGEALCRAGVKAASLLGQAGAEHPPNEVETFTLPPLSDLTRQAVARPRVFYIFYLNSQGDLRDMLLFGQNTRALLPSLIHPNCVLDGAIVNLGYTRPQKNTTYTIANHALIKELYKRHDRDLSFTGVIVANHFNTYKDKEKTAALCAQLVSSVLGSDAVIITKDGGGQADVDLMVCCERCEERGLKTVILATEGTGQEGTSVGALADFSPQADAIISTGIRSQRLTLPTVERVIGAAEELSIEELEVTITQIVGALGFLGDSPIGGIED